MSYIKPLTTAVVLATEYDALKAENERLTRERDEAFRMSRCECGPDECCANLVKLHEDIARLRKALQELVALVRGECPRLLDEDRDGDARLSIEIDAALSHTQEQVK